MIDQKRLRELVKLMVDNDLTELDLEDKGGERVSLKRGHGGGAVIMPAAAPPASAAAPPAGEPAPPADDGLARLDSPMVGTFYAAPSPDAPLFVKVGDHVDEETVICIIEAMKVFNEIKAESAGTIEQVLVENGQAVEFGQPLFKLRPDH